jgi:hypothetical protein
MSPRWGSTPRLTDRQSQCDSDFDFGSVSVCVESPGELKAIERLVQSAYNRSE